LIHTCWVGYGEALKKEPAEELTIGTAWSFNPISRNLASDGP
jgi:hypothetical protein